MQIKHVVKEETELITLLTELGFSKDYSSELLRKRTDIKINGQVYGKNYMLHPGDVVEIETGDERSDIPVSIVNPVILFEDEYFLAVNKPQNLASIPTIAHYEDNLASRVKKHFEDTDQKCGIHILNRLDFETAGVVVFSKNRFIANMAKKCEIHKVYEATVQGILKEKSGVIDKPILKVGNSKKRIIDESGKRAVTEYKVIDETGKTSRVEFVLVTGRTHQIRIHMASINHPLIGDKLYGTGEGQIDLKFKHIDFVLPINGKDYSFDLR